MYKGWAFLALGPRTQWSIVLPPCSQEPTTEFSPEPDESIPHPFTLFFKIHFNIVTCTPIARQRFVKHILIEGNLRNSRTSIAGQRSCKRASLTIEDCVFRGIRTEETSWRQLKVHLWNINRIRFVTKQRLASGHWRHYLCVIVIFRVLYVVMTCECPINLFM
jgi:hypothetical protein